MRWQVTEPCTGPAVLQGTGHQYPAESSPPPQAGQKAPIARGEKRGWSRGWPIHGRAPGDLPDAVRPHTAVLSATSRFDLHRAPQPPKDFVQGNTRIAFGTSPPRARLRGRKPKPDGLETSQRHSHPAGLGLRCWPLCVLCGGRPGPPLAPARPGTWPVQREEWLGTSLQGRGKPFPPAGGRSIGGPQ